MIFFYNFYILPIFIFFVRKDINNYACFLVHYFLYKTPFIRVC